MVLHTGAEQEQAVPESKRPDAAEPEARPGPETGAEAERPDASPIVERRAGPSRRLVVVLLVLGWLAGVAWRVWLSRTVQMPIAHTDEDSYLNAARVFAGGPGGYSSENSVLRRAGYQLLISPAFLGDHTFTTSYGLVRLINAMVNAALLPLAYLLGTRVLRVPRWPALGIAAVAATMPATVFYSLFALTDSVLAALTVAWILLLAAWLRRPNRPLAAFGASAAAGAYYLIHVRGTVVLAVHLLVVLVWVVRRRTGIRPLGVVLATAAAAVAGNEVLIRLLDGKLALAGNDPGGSTLRALLSTKGAGFVLASLATQTWYVLVITGGLAALGWFAAGRLALGRGTDPAQRWLALAALAATVGVALGCALILVGVPSATRDAAYARYIHAFAPLWLVYGLAVVFRARRRALLTGYAVAAALTVAGGGFVAWRLSDAVRHGSPLRYGVFGAPDLMAMTAGWTSFRPLVGTAVGLAVGAAVVLLARFRWGWQPALAAVVAGQLLMMGLLADRVLAPLSDYLGPSPTLAQLGLREGESVATSSAYHLGIRLNHEHEITWMSVPNFVSQPPASAEVVVARWYPQPGPRHSWDWDGTKYGYHRIGGNPDQHWSLWRRND
ncbi:hypothetical protein [Micromonospora krabiensis]|uniref:4-amino-4-deoxy-L-arabinose transferase n=2 Tax=Micromonospora krabiensis TaxID=307121 RepID=A0A1C3NC29_9ACTN|nr:hypothetical protein [Micromonospora krabiensis]SBV30109.1 4-amino-4-deoxy-L-arabinose transferase [Micromonospora krabiensis]